MENMKINFNYDNFCDFITVYSYIHINDLNLKELFSDFNLLFKKLIRENFFKKSYEISELIKKENIPTNIEIRIDNVNKIMEHTLNSFGVVKFVENDIENILNETIEKLEKVNEKLYNQLSIIDEYYEEYKNIKKFVEMELKNFMENKDISSYDIKNIGLHFVSIFTDYKFITLDDN